VDFDRRAAPASSGTIRHTGSRDAAWLPERQVYGPEPASERDIEGLNRVFADAFTDVPRTGSWAYACRTSIPVLALRPARRRPGAMLCATSRARLALTSRTARGRRVDGPPRVRPDRQGAEWGRHRPTALDWLLERMWRRWDSKPCPVRGEIGSTRGSGSSRSSHGDVDERHQSRAGIAPRCVVAAQRCGRWRTLEAARHLVAALAPGYDYREILSPRTWPRRHVAHRRTTVDALVLWHSAHSRRAGRRMKCAC